jgi:hypothetical protein
MIIAIDFDGTCVTHEFPNLGKDIGAQEVLKQLVDNGHKLILCTMRSTNHVEQTVSNGYKIFGGDFLQPAVDWFEANNIPLYGIQRNPEQDSWTTSPKVHAHLIIDDTALGCPLKYIPDFHSRPFVDWIAVENILIQMKLI